MDSGDRYSDSFKDEVIDDEGMEDDAFVEEEILDDYDWD